MDLWTDILGNWLLRTSLEGAALILIVLALGKTLGRHLGPRWRVLLWTAVGVKLLLPASLPLVPGFGNWGRETSSAVNNLDESAPAVEKVFLIEREAPLVAKVDDETGTRVTLSTWLLILWVAGVLAFSVATLVRQRRFLRGAGLEPCRDPELLALVGGIARELELRRDFTVCLAPEDSTPAVCGCFRATLLVPRNWKSAFGAETLRPILLHELEHIRQGDLFINWLAVAVNALHWFNPLVWIAASRFQCDRELRCDINALSRMQPIERIGYGRALLRVQREFRPAPAIAGVAPCVRNHPSLQQRIHMIAKPTPEKRWLNAILVPGIAGIIALSFGSATADDKRPDPPREGDKPREGDHPRDGGPRDGGPREGGPREEGRSREGDRPREGGPREDGRSREGDRPREGERGREGERPRDGGPREGGPRGGMHEGEVGVFVVRDGVRMGDRVIPMSSLRGEFSKLHARTALVSAEPEIPFHQVNQVLDALRDTGIRDIRVGGPRGREGGPRPEGAPRDGDRPRPEGAPRDGDRPRPEGAPRDGDRPRPEGAPRDGDGPKREGAPRNGDRPKPEGQN